jgi:hypothetical protein
MIECSSRTWKIERAPAPDAAPLPDVREYRHLGYREGKELPMPSRSLALTALVAACTSSVITLAVALSALPAAIRAAPDSQAPPRLVQAERFELVDSSGAVRASLDMESNGVGLTLRDESGTSRVVLVADPRVGRGLFVTDQTSRGAVFVGASTANNIGLQVTSPQGPKAYIQANATGTGFGVTDSAARPVWQAL